MEGVRCASRPNRKGHSEWFMGEVSIEPIVDAKAPGRTSSALVNFKPGARTAWHTHPLGQTLYVTHGKGWVQIWGGPITEINLGDVIWFPPDEKHWQGATVTTALSHIAIHEALDGKSVGWLEQVSEDQYRS